MTDALPTQCNEDNEWLLFIKLWRILTAPDAGDEDEKVFIDPENVLSSCCLLYLRLKAGYVNEIVVISSEYVY